jgi:hypothetical protein
MPKRVDENQADIIEALRDIGVSVFDLHEIGKGCPDILCGFAGRNILLEIKCGNARLNDKERKFKDSWKGQYAVVRTPEEAIELMRFLI